MIILNDNILGGCLAHLGASQHGTIMLRPRPLFVVGTASNTIAMIMMISQSQIFGHPEIALKSSQNHPKIERGVSKSGGVRHCQLQIFP